MLTFKMLHRKTIKIVLILILLALTATPALASSCQEFIAERELRREIWDNLLDIYEEEVKSWRDGTSNDEKFCTMMGGFKVIGTEQLNHQKREMSCLCKEKSDACADITEYVLSNEEKLSSILEFTNTNCSS